jgi:ATP-binding cassette subfamily B protein
VGVPPSGALTGVHVLVVEDDDDARNILDSVLTYLGAVVATASSAATALNILAQVKADVVICDVNLGDNNAIWLVRRAQQHQPGTPFIAISAQDYDEHEMRVAGFSAYLRKPVQQDMLVTRILGALER